MRTLAIVLVACLISAVPALAQTRQPTAQEAAAIRDCVGKYEDDAEIEKNCLHKLVADPCIEKNPSTHGMADCHRIETAIWDRILNENFKELMESLEHKEQQQKLREMQRAWIVSRDRTCEYYWHQIRGSMAVLMAAACLARETARRAMLLKAFGSL